MGKIFLPPLKFLLFFIISAAAFLFFALLFNWEQWFSPALENGNSLLLFLPSAASGVIFPAASSGLLFSLFEFRKSSIKLLSVIFTAAALFAVLFFGFRFTTSMENPAKTAFQPFNEKKIHVTDSSIIYTDEVTTDNTPGASGIVIRSKNSDIPGFRYYQSATLLTEDGQQPALRIDSNRVFNIVPANPVFYEIFTQEQFLGNYLADMGYLNNSLKDAAGSGGLDFIILTAVFTAFLLSSMLYRGASAWPLFDFALILFFHRLAFYLFGLFSREAEFISETFFGGRQGLNIPLFTIGGLTLILFLCGILIKTTSKRNT